MQPSVSNAISSPEGIGSAYGGDVVANTYIGKRFASELMALLHEKQVAEVQRVFDKERPQVTLEIAPGPGRLTRDLLPSGRLVCLEYNEGMIRSGEAACKNGAVWMKGDAFSLPFGQEFDFVYSFRFIRHFRRPERRQLYEQVRKALKVKGHFLFDAVNERVSRPLRVRNPESYPIYDELYPNPQTIISEVEEEGFRVVRLTGVQRCFPVQSLVQNLVGPRSRWLCRSMIRALEKFRFASPLEWIVTCRYE